MIIILKKDGQIITDDGNPVEGGKLENAAAILADPKDGDTIVYDADAGMWVAGIGGGSFEPDITNPQDGDTLVYDASEEKWVNGSGGGGSGGGILVAHLDTTTYAIDKTWKEVHDAMADGIIVLIPFVDDDDAFNYIAVSAVIRNGGYRIECDVSGEVSLVTDNANGYPVLS